MQGFNKYYPPDYDSRETSTLNSYRGVHALGVRAKDIDKGILVVRFELPFNIWCGHCNSHLGAGVRYNAQKRKVGAYYSTPIYAFRCKCHLCSGWFEIRTDPKNAKYVVEEGARAQEQDWDPEENGDTEGPSAADPPADAFQALEKTTIQKTQTETQTERIESLAKLSYRQTSDPYTMSQHLRQRLREEKRVERDRTMADEQVSGKYGLGERVRLLPATTGEGKAEWDRATRSAPRSNTKDLSTTLRRNTVERYNPFGAGASEMGRVGRGKMGTVVKSVSSSRTAAPPVSVLKPAVGLTGLVGYASDDDDDGS